MRLHVKMTVIITISLFILLIATATTISADTGEITNTGGMNMIDILWMLMAIVMVFAMAPGLALFYGGMLRKQSMISTIAQCIMGMSVTFLMWIVAGYSLAFGGDIYGFIGGFENMLMNGVSSDSSSFGLGISDMQFMVFQGMFSVVSSCIIVGSSAERARFPAIMAFLMFWSILVYAPMAHMVWGGGILSTEGGILTTLDYAGGTVVHICSGISGVAIAYVLGKRSSRIIKDRPHNIPLMFLGAILIWVGWFGFNGGSGLTVDDGLIIVIMNTLIASLSGVAVWVLLQTFLTGRTSVTGMCAGCVAGLVAITPGCAFVNASMSILIGAIGSMICYWGIEFMRKRSGVDDALDVFGLHGLGGIWGAVAIGIFALPELTDTPGLLFGGIDLFAGQFVAVGFTLVYCFIVSYVIMKLISFVMRIRLTEEEEMIGADIIEHGESAYN